MFNKVILVGNCTKDGELRFSQNGSEIYNNSIATSRKFTLNGERKEETMFVDFTAFAKLGGVCNQYLRKGSKILIEGRLSFEQWVDKTSGQKRSKHSVIVETMQMLDSKGSNEESQEYEGEKQPYQAPTPQYEKKTMPQNELPSIDVDDLEIPF